jgi:hypothetical protein
MDPLIKAVRSAADPNPNAHIINIKLYAENVVVVKYVHIIDKKSETPDGRFRLQKCGKEITVYRLEKKSFNELYSFTDTENFAAGFFELHGYMTHCIPQTKIIYHYELILKLFIKYFMILNINEFNSLEIIFNYNADS